MIGKVPSLTVSCAARTGMTRLNALKSFALSVMKLGIKHLIARQKELLSVLSVKMLVILKTDVLKFTVVILSQNSIGDVLNVVKTDISNARVSNKVARPS